MPNWRELGTTVYLTVNKRLTIIEAIIMTKKGLPHESVSLFKIKENCELILKVSPIYSDCNEKNRKLIYKDLFGSALASQRLIIKIQLSFTMEEKLWVVRFEHQPLD